MEFEKLNESNNAGFSRFMSNSYAFGNCKLRDVLENTRNQLKDTKKYGLQLFTNSTYTMLQLCIERQAHNPPRDLSCVRACVVVVYCSSSDGPSRLDDVMSLCLCFSISMLGSSFVIAH
eukprot:PhF_6_TR10599/c2_g1_i8/m.17052